MARAYSMDLKQRIVAGCKAGESLSTVAKRFAISYWTVRSYVKRAEKGELAEKLRSGKPRRLDEEGVALLRQQVEKHPDWTLAEHSEGFLSLELYSVLCQNIKT